MTKIALLIPSVLLVTSLAACNLQTAIDPSQTISTTPVASQTSGQTQETTLTPSPAGATETVQPTSNNNLATPKPSASPSAQAVASSVPTVTCNRAAPGNPIDISIPDETEMLPGQSFTKTWRLVNMGSCSWTREYAVVWFSGESFGASQRQLLSSTTAAGQTIDISVDMRAPEQPGTYQSNWKLSAVEGELFGIGPNGDAPFWVRIVVRATPTAPVETLPTAAPTPAVYMNGVTNLPPGESLDLDAVQVAGADSADLAYSIDASGAHLLTPLNGAEIGSFSTLEPSIDQCQTGTLDTKPISLDNVPIGSYFCFQSDLSLPGWVRLVLISPSDNLLALEVLTWAIP
ncbi:MAG TPA: NBR1-Ig-like domain-containing protein [Anaerolineaceae bacterium]|nr:NBR1-Ig-like domain-containing protein [Anaerolineaceae bacterium]